MSLQPETLQNPEEYTLLRELAHQDLLSFVQSQLRIKNSIRTVFYVLNIAIVVLVVIVVFLRFRNGQLQGAEVLLQASLGFFLFFIILLPLHEWIHGLAYRKVGAEKVSYVAQWRKLVFYALAAFRRLFPFRYSNRIHFPFCFAIAHERLYRRFCDGQLFLPAPPQRSVYL